jgi:hypothetical protein
MPKTPIDYSKAIIYSIVCKTDDTLLYIGSTTNFTQRKYCHKSTCNNKNSENHNVAVYVMIRGNGGWNNFDMKPVKEFPCENIIQLIIEEERIRKEINANLNTNRAYTTPEEYKEHQKEWHKNNAEYVTDRQKKYYAKNAKHIVEQQKQYYQANKQRIQEQNRIKRQELKNAL